MTDEQPIKYEPETVSAPGTSLKRTLDALGLKQKELARRAGVSTKHISKIINGEASITPEKAMAFERVLDVPASFWTERQRQYDEAKAAQADKAALEEHTSWLSNFPISEMIELGFIDKFEDEVEQLRALLDFFGVAGPKEWRSEWSETATAFRKQEVFESSKYDTAVWLRTGEKKSREMPCTGYSKYRFKEALKSIRTLTREPIDEFFRLAQKRLCKAGVALVFVPELPSTRVHGATRWLAPDRALIQVSTRYKRDDIFFFTLFHEAAHILKHRKKDIFLETEDPAGEYEDEADKFAQDFLIPPKRYEEFKANHDFSYLSYDDIEAFAEKLQIAPSIVVGRLYHDELVPNTHFRKLIRSVNPGDLEEMWQNY